MEKIDYNNYIIEDLKCCGNCIHAMHIGPEKNNFFGKALFCYSFMCRKKNFSSSDMLCKDWVWDTVIKEYRMIK